MSPHVNPRGTELTPATAGHGLQLGQEPPTDSSTRALQLHSSPSLLAAAGEEPLLILLLLFFLLLCCPLALLMG